MHHLSRRDFLIQTAATSAMIGAGLAAGPANAHADGEQRIRIGLSQYSLRQLFQSGELDVLDYPIFARDQFGISEIDVWEGGMPTEQQNDRQWLKRLKQRAEDAGSNLFLWMTQPVDCAVDKEEQQQSEIRRMQTPINNATVLDCRYVRIFVKAPEIDRSESLDRCVDTLVPIADYAKSHQRVLVIEPGASEPTRDGAFLAELMQRMRHDHCRLMPDFGKLRGDVYAGTRAVMPHADVVSAKSHNFDSAGNERELDYGRLIKIIKTSGFAGIIAIEYEGKETPPIEGVAATKKLIERYL